MELAPGWPRAQNGNAGMSPAAGGRGREGGYPRLTAFRTPGDAARRAPAFDPTVAQPARVYDYWLGGKDNFAADRVAGEQAIGAYPAIRSSARANRAFLARAVRYLAGQRGIRQYLDLGTGLPSAPNTHEVAQSIAPQARVVYVDNDPMVVSHARALLAGGPQGITEHVEADLRDTGAILARVAAVLDFTEPIAVMLLAVLEYLSSLDEIRQTLGRLIAAIPPGSFLVISHAASDISPTRMAEMTRRLNGHLTGASYAARTRDVVTGFFDGLDLVDPGVVKVTQWHPQSQIESARRTSQWGGVALKPEDPRRH
jgi:O-methyltransferase involved in polyketide biosynthesis